VRVKGTEPFKRRIKAAQGLRDTRRICSESPEFKQELEKSLNPVIQILDELAKRAELTGRKF